MTDVDTNDERTADPVDRPPRRRLPVIDALSPLQKTLAAVGVLIVGFLLPLGGLLTNQGPPMEEGFMLVFPEMVLNGFVPNRDFLHLYGPGSLWILAGVFAVFEPSLVAERLFGLAQQMGIVFGVFVIAKAWGRTVALWCGAISLVIIVPPIGLTALAWVGAVALGLWAVHAGLRARFSEDEGWARRAAVIAGVLAGFALLFRPDLIVALTLSGVVLVRGMPWRRVRMFFVGGAIGVSPYLVHIAMAGFMPAFRGMVLDPVIYLRGGRTLPLPPSPFELQGFLQKAGDMDPLAWPIPMLSTPAQITVWFFVLLLSAAALAVGSAVLVRRRPGSARARTLAVVAAFSVGLLPQAIQRADSTHLAWVGCVVMAFLPVLLVELLAQRRPAWSPRTRGLVAGGTVFGLIALLLPAFTLRSYTDATVQTFGYHKRTYAITHEGRTFYYGRPDVAADLNPVIARAAELSEPGDRLFVGTSDLRFTPYADSFIYFLLPELVPSTYYIEMDPGVANRVDSGLDEDVASADIVILSKVWDDWDEPNDSRIVGSDAPNMVMEEQFCKEELDVELFELYTRC
jgi:hypothetical protein